jgi:hypothetical protein
MLHFDHGYVTCLHVPSYLVGDACAQNVAILLVHFSILAREAHACICRLDSCITNKGEESTQLMFPGGVLHQGKKNWEKCICSGGLAFMHLGALFLLNFSCALLPVVSSPFASP